MNIEITDIRENEDDTSIEMVITDDDGQQYDFRCDAPKYYDPETYCEQNAEKFMLLVLGKMYPGCPRHETLEERRQWIKDGCLNEKGEFVEKKEYPKKPKEDLIDENHIEKIKKARTIADLKKAILEII